MKSNIFNGINTVKAIFTTILFFSIVSFAFAQDCNTDLEVRNNFDIRPLDKDGTTFILEITNNSTAQQTYEFFTEFSRCDIESNTNTLTFRKELPVNTNFYSNNSRRPNNIITVEGNSTKRITLKITPTSFIEPETFSCLKVIAKNASCRLGAISTNVQIFIPNQTDKD